MKKLFVALLTVLLCLYCLPGGLVSAIGREQVIRVGYPIQKGLTEVDASGQYSGYTYDYLEEIAQYTGWDYEFVQVPGDINTRPCQSYDGNAEAGRAGSAGRHELQRHAR